MFAKQEHPGTVCRGSDTIRRNRRRCVPGVVALEDRGLLSGAGAELTHAAVSVHVPLPHPILHAAQVHAVPHALAHAEHAAIAAARAVRVHFPGGGVVVTPHGTRVVFPGGSVHAGRFGAAVHFPGGFVVSSFGRTVVRFPGGLIRV
jgi:hypothetical protein